MEAALSQTTVETLVPDIDQDRMADRVAIRQLLSQYCHRIDNGTDDGVGRLWLPDGILELGFTANRKQYHGREALTAWFRDHHKAGSERKDTCLHPRHSISNPVIRFISENEARIAVNIWAHDVRGGRATFFSGYYRDEVIRSAGRWWFKIKRIHICHSWSPDNTVVYRTETLCYF